MNNPVKIDLFEAFQRGMYRGAWAKSRKRYLHLGDYPARDFFDPSLTPQSIGFRLFRSRS